MKKMLLCIGFLLSMNFSFAQELDAGELVARSIAFHDPKNHWPLFADTIDVLIEAGKNEFKKRKVFLDNRTSSFAFWGFYEDGVLKFELLGDSTSYKWNGNEAIPESIRKKYKLNADRVRMYRNYYLYLFGMPMKLLDKGTILHEAELVKSIYAESCYKLHVSYIPSVGTDTWFFYFDKESFELLGYEFYKEKPGDGEYIILKGLKEVDGIKFSENRDWYETSGGKYLGRDIFKG